MKLRDFASLALAATVSLAPFAASAADDKDKHSVTTQVPTSPPVAGKRDYNYTRHGVTISDPRSEEHTSELQSLMRISYAVFCLKKKTKTTYTPQQKTNTTTKRQKQKRTK